MKIVQKKICLLGDFYVGKTSLIRRFVEERFDENYLSTIGVHLSRKRLERNEHSLDFFIWDLVGGEDFSKIGVNYLRGAAGAIIVCDLTRPETLPFLNYYAKEMLTVNDKASLLFVANKVDLEQEHSVVESDLLDVIKPYSDRYFRTSAKTGQNVTQVFEQLANWIEQ
jgi:small GTP-binding protein